MIDISFFKVYVDNFMPNPNTTVYWFSEYSELLNMLDYMVGGSKENNVQLPMAIDKEGNSMVDLEGAALIYLEKKNEGIQC